MKRLLLAIGLAATLLGTAIMPAFADATDYTLENSGTTVCVNYRASALNPWNEAGVTALSTTYVP